MNRHIQLPDEKAFYHIQIAGDTGRLFNADEDYQTFKAVYLKRMNRLFSTYAYSLLPDHIHLLIRKREKYGCKKLGTILHSQIGRVLSMYDPAGDDKEWDRKLFNRFELSAVKINPFHFTSYVSYIHIDAERHGCADNFTGYPHSSYAGFLAKNDSIVDNWGVMRWFHSDAHFIRFHEDMYKIHLEGKFIPHEQHPIRGADRNTKRGAVSNFE